MPQELVVEDIDVIFDTVPLAERKNILYSCSHVGMFPKAHVIAKLLLPTGLKFGGLRATHRFQPIFVLRRSARQTAPLWRHPTPI